VSGRVLVIADDNPAMRWLVRQTFRDQFTEILEANDGRELFWTLVRCSRTRAASDVVVITDIRMPAYSGLDVLAACDELGYHPPTVVMTSFPDADAYATTARAGVVLLPKPFGTSELRRVVEDVRAR
jgi:DNA-binding NtrC family response regulator